MVSLELWIWHGRLAFFLNKCQLWRNSVFLCNNFTEVFPISSSETPQPSCLHFEFYSEIAAPRLLSYYKRCLCQ